MYLLSLPTLEFEMSNYQYNLDLTMNQVLVALQEGKTVTCYDGDKVSLQKGNVKKYNLFFGWVDYVENDLPFTEIV